MKDPQKKENSNFETDPQLDQLLDDALTPADIPEGLVDSIMNATTDKLSADRQQPADAIARVGLHPFLRVAAVVALAVTVILFGSLWPRQTENQTDSATAHSELAADIQAYAQTIESITDDQASIDEELDLLEMDLELAQMAGDWDVVTDPFDQVPADWNDDLTSNGS